MNTLYRHWAYYIELLKYKREPTPDKKEELSKRFDKLFAMTNDYAKLNERIFKTLDKKTVLLQVLALPHLTLRNNAAELGAGCRHVYAM
ncbi:MAG: hypothetical protein ACXWT4_14230 [Methylobacter sp.]